MHANHLVIDLQCLVVMHMNVIHLVTELEVLGGDANALGSLLVKCLAVALELHLGFLRQFLRCLLVRC